MTHHSTVSIRPIRRRSRSFRIIAIAGCVAIAALFAACSSDSSDDSTAATTTTTAESSTPGTATISVFDVPESVTCAKGETSTKVPVKYQTVGATSQLLLVDGREIDGTKAADATVDVDVHCDTVPHTVVLVAYDANKNKTSQQKILNTELG